MESVGQFFSALKTDIQIWRAGTDTQAEDLQKRKNSVANRIYGLALLVFAVITLAMAATATTPLGVISWIVLTALFAVLAHDFMVLGDNQSKELAVLVNPAPPNQGWLARGAAIIKSAGQAIGMVANELYHDRPHALNGTWLFEPIYRCCHKDS